MAKLKRTNKNILKVLKKHELKVRSNKYWACIIEGNVNGKKVNIGCSRLSALILKGKVLPQYIKDNSTF